MTQLGKYELHEILGKGGFGTVYRATDTSLRREVAVKVLHPQLMVDENFVERFKKEARILASFDHPNIVTIYDMGEVDGRAFIAMKYLSGGNLQARIQKEGGLPFEEAKRIMGQVCEGLQMAHEQGMVHRDLKPANILFDQRGNAVISDFGLAKIVQMSGASSSMGIAGTPAYRAPELWRGTPPASPATDVYSLGCIFVEMLTGKVLFDGVTPDEIITQHLIDGPKFPGNWKSIINSEKREIVERSLHKDQNKRQKDAKGLFYELNTSPDENKEDCLQEKSNIIPTRKQKEEISLTLSSGITMDFVRIPAGEYWMGTNTTIDEFSRFHEQPQHRIYLDEFWMAKYPVTTLQYKEFINRNPQETSNDFYSLPKNGDNFPIVSIPWGKAVAFCDWLRKITKVSIRLPFEAEWEKACRGADINIFPWGNELPDQKKAAYEESFSDLIPIDQYHEKDKSSFGVMRKTGNLWEWVSDWYDCDYYKNSPASNPQGPNFGKNKVIRGGSWKNSLETFRLTARWCMPPNTWDDTVGFRVCFDNQYSNFNKLFN